LDVEKMTNYGKGIVESLSSPEYKKIEKQMFIPIIGVLRKKIEERLKSLSGNEYLALSQEEKSDIVKKSLDRYTTWKFWKRPDLCDYVLNENSLTSLYQKAAENAKENLMVHSFVVYATEECIKQGQFSK